MWRWVETAIRCIKRGIPSIRQGTLEVTRQVSSVQHAIVPFTINQERSIGINRYGNFFFKHWLQMTSRTTRLKCNPVQRIRANQRNSTPFLLTFLGFTYMGTNMDSDSSCHAKKDQQLNSWLQNALKTTFESIPEKSVSHEGNKLKDYEICERLGKPSSNSAVYAAKTNDSQCAIKMLFNFAASSQSHSLNRAFSKEVTVLSGAKNQGSTTEAQPYTSLPQHYNIMKISWHFADRVPQLPDAIDSYPAALPSHLYQDGYGRNRTLFLVMPRFKGTLADYVSAHQGSMTTKTSLILLVQLLEGLVHLNKNGIAHRDLKNDNLLVEEGSEGVPHLVITDFGCCLAERDFGLVMPYETGETSKGGNIHLMAPEVLCAKPGPGVVIDYSKADEWAAGAIAYEMFGQRNPFEDHTVNKETYKSCDLPELANAPHSIQQLVKQLLQRHPNDRPPVSLAATVCQIVLWAPELCKPHESEDNLSELVRRWLRNEMFCLAMKMTLYKTKDDIPVTHQVWCSFLSRTTSEEILEALQWMSSSM